VKVGKYQIGRFHAIIRKEYADGSVDYETSFTDIEDFNESYYCILKCIGKEVGIATDNPKVLTYDYYSDLRRRGKSGRTDRV
jgi:hypothetical protein